MSNLQPPNANNSYQAKHVDLLLKSYKHWTGKELVNSDDAIEEQARKIFYAPFAVVSHNTLDDPVFNYGNDTALKLFEMDWQKFTKLQSRKSAEPMNREERNRLLKRVAEYGFINDYKGVRITASGKRFMIENATVWNVIDESGKYHGQAATFDNWKFL